ncbi:MAG: MFS transporter [Deltaproteobacteria bacterium]|nr:MFS transporter [Deltaproteobacteria bacterium]
MPSDPAVGWPVRIAFGLGSYAEGILYGAFSYFLLFFYNQVLGLSGSLAGTALAIALVVDAATDPLVGSISDRHRSRWGRRHPFMYGSALPFALVFYLLFVPPEGLGEAGLFAWLLCFSVATRTALTFFSVPHMTLGAELTPDYDERTTLAAVRSFLSIAGGVSVIMVGFVIFFGEDGQLDPANYPGFALTASIAMAATILLSGIGTHSCIPRLSKAPAEQVHFSVGRLLRELRHAMGLRPFRFILSSMIANAAVMGLLSTLATYILTFFFRLEGLTLGVQLSTGMAGGVLGAVIASPIAARMKSKRNAKILGMLWFAFFTSLMVNARLLGWAPANGDPWLLPLLLGGSFIGGLGMGLISVLGNAMIADVTDEHERVYGTRQEGIYYSAVSFVSKATSGLGTLLAGIAIDFVGLNPNADPASVPSTVIDGLGIVYGPCVLLMILAPVGLLWGYDIDRKRHEEIRREIAEAKTTSAV